MKDLKQPRLFVSGPTLEPPLPRRKKCPELAYKTHEFMTAADGGGIDAVDSNVVADKVRVSASRRACERPAYFSDTTQNERLLEHE